MAVRKKLYAQQVTYTTNKVKNDELHVRQLAYLRKTQQSNEKQNTRYYNQPVPWQGEIN